MAGKGKWGQIRKLKAEGLLPGAPDLVLIDLAPTGEPVAVEMKRQKGGVLSDDQKHVHAVMRRAGWVVVVGYGAMHAVKQLQEIGF